jgi:hypothetical protein
MENWYQVFYWLTVADGVKSFFDVASNIFTWLAVIGLIGYIVAIGISLSDDGTDYEGNTTPEMKRIRKMFGWIFWGFTILSLFTWIGYVAVPTKKDAVMILVGGSVVEFITTDSVARQIPSELLILARNEIQSAAAEAKVDLGIQSQKDKILQEAKNMSTLELMDRMKVDSTFAKIILNQ